MRGRGGFLRTLSLEDSWQSCSPENDLGQKTEEAVMAFAQANYKGESSSAAVIWIHFQDEDWAEILSFNELLGASQLSLIHDQNKSWGNLRGGDPSQLASRLRLWFRKVFKYTLKASV